MATKPQPSPLARQLFAEALEQQGQAYENAANSVRAGFTNFWIGPALRAIDTALDTTRDHHVD